MENLMMVLKLVAFILLVVIFMIWGIFAICRAAGWMTFRKSEEKIRQSVGENGLHLRFHQTNPVRGAITYLSAEKQDPDPHPEFAIVFVHGSPGAKDAFLPYLKNDQLLNRAVLYAMDRPGFGYSDFGRPESSLAQQAAKLMEVVREVRENRVLLVGHSFGCAVIARAAMEHPEEIDGIHLIAGTLAPEAEPHNWWRKIIDLPLISRSIPVALVTCNREMLPLKQELQKMLPLWDRVTCPVTLVHGTGDWIVNFKNLPRTMERLVHAKRLRTVTLKGDGHLILWQKMELMADEIIKTIEMIKG